MTTTMPLPRPTVTAPRPWHFPATTRIGLPNGLTVIGCHMPGQYLAGVTAVLDVPIDWEPVGKDGVLTLVARTMDEGTQEYTPEEFARAVQLLGARYRADVGRTGMWIDVDVPVRNLDPAAGLLAEALRRPVFGEADVSRHRLLRLGEIDHEEADPNRRSHQEFAGQLFTGDTRFSRPTGGTRETVGTLTGEILAAFHAAYVTPARTTLIFAGDLTGIDVADIVERHFGTWRVTGASAAPAAVPVFAAHKVGCPHIVVVNRPGSVQTNLVFGCEGLDRYAADWTAHRVAAHVLGGSTSSRLNTLLREGRGYTYGFRTGYRTFQRGGFFTISGSVRNGVAGRAIADTLGLLESCARDGLQTEECAAAVRQLTRIAPLRCEKAGEVRVQLADLVADRLPLDFIDTSLASLHEVTAATASAALRELHGSRPMIVIALGSADEITAQLEAVGLTVAVTRM